jgi:hypothetical protein
MIHNPSELNTRKRFKVLICGVPGIGKTTLALSAPGVILIDVDGGWDRVAVQNRRAIGYIQPANYKELMADLSSPIMAEAETIAMDTGGAFIGLLKAWAIEINPSNGQKDGVTLSQRGYGVVGAEFVRFTDMIYNQLGKNLVILFHAKEDVDGEQKVFRLDVEGQTRSNVWKPMDLGGFMEAVGNRRTIGFSPTDRYFAKGTHGISGVIQLPDLDKGAPNDFLTTLFAKVNENIAGEALVRAEYDKLMATITNLVAEVKTAKDANDAVVRLATLNYVFGAKTQAWNMLSARATAVGCKYDPVAKMFLPEQLFDLGSGKPA